MIILTGAAGFIGSCILSKLNECKYEEIILVDHFDSENDPKKINLKNKKYLHYYDKKEFINLISEDKIDKNIDALIHMGACSSTTGSDAKYYHENNLEYSIKLAKWSRDNNVRFIYASSAATYGDGSNGYKDDTETARKCKPLNLYGKSKQDFDVWILDNGLEDKVVGLKFFNVFGPNESHKQDMRSVIAKAYQKVVDEGVMHLFKSYKEGYSNGEQKRDFIYVKDAVDIVMFFFNNPQINGIFNVGTGKARTWNDLAAALFKAAGKDINIKYVDMPEHLKDKYQYFTEADMSKLRNKGYKKEFLSLEDSVLDYVGYLKENKSL